MVLLLLTSRVSVCINTNKNMHVKSHIIGYWHDCDESGIRVASHYPAPLATLFTCIIQGAAS